MSTIIEVAAEAKVPKAPNYVTSADDRLTLRVGDLTDESLRKIATAWTENLFANAERQRKEKVSPS